LSRKRFDTKWPELLIIYKQKKFRFGEPKDKWFDAKWSELMVIYKQKKCMLGEPKDKRFDAKWSENYYTQLVIVAVVALVTATSAQHYFIYIYPHTSYIITYINVLCVVLPIPIIRLLLSWHLVTYNQYITPLRRYSIEIFTKSVSIEHHSNN